MKLVIEWFSRNEEKSRTFTDEQGKGKLTISTPKIDNDRR